jgi:MATE family, multidrug efflux pump
MKNKRKELLSGSILKSILAISIPIIIANALQTVYQLIDTFWVGRLGIGAMAAVSLSFPILFFLASLATGLTVAGTILIAQYNGKGNTRKVSLAVGQSFSLVIIIAIVLSAIGYLLSEFLLSLMTKDPVVLEQAVTYLRISFLAVPAMFIYYIFQSALHGVGEVKIPMLIILATVIINFFIDPIFMFGWGFIPAMGVAGVALATFITESLAAAVGIFILIKGSHGVKLRANCLRIRKAWAIRIFKLGIPSSFEMSSRSLGMVLMTFIVAGFGTLAVASFGVGVRVLSFVIIPSIGFSIAASTLVGNNLGAGKKIRAKKIASTGIRIGFFVMTFLGILLFVFADKVTYFLAPADLSLVATSAQFIRVMALTFGFIGIQMVIIGILKAAGKTTMAMALAMFHVFVLVSTGFLLSKVGDFGQVGIWIAYPIANTLALGLAIIFYKRKTWLKKKLV